MTQKIKKTPAQITFDIACESHDDVWLPASGGTEEPFVSRSGITLLYCFNPKEMRHAYLNVDDDIILTDAEATLLMAMF